MQQVSTKLKDTTPSQEKGSELVMNRNLYPGRVKIKSTWLNLLNVK